MAWEITSAILSSLGGATVIILALSAFLGKILASRVAASQNEEILSKLETLKSELSLTQKSYEQQIEHVVSYYTTYYSHYRRCQKVAGTEILRHPDLGDRCTKELFEEELDDFKEKWDSLEARVRLILPDRAYELHQESIENFNEFNRLVKSLSSNHSNKKEGLREKFKVIEATKVKLEKCLRNYLRTNESRNN